MFDSESLQQRQFINSWGSSQLFSPFYKQCWQEQGAVRDRLGHDVVVGTKVRPELCHDLLRGCAGEVISTRLYQDL